MCRSVSLRYCNYPCTGWARVRRKSAKNVKYFTKGLPVLAVKTCTRLNLLRFGLGDAAKNLARRAAECVRRG